VRVVAVAAFAVSALLLLAAVAGLLPGTEAAAYAAAICPGAFAVLLGRQARTAARADRPRTARAAGLFAAALGVAAVACLGAAVAVHVANGSRLAGVPLPAELSLIAAFLAAGLYLLGLPRSDRPPAGLARLRQCLDGASFAVFTLLVSWLLIFNPIGVRGGGLTAALLTSAACGVALVIGLPASRERRGVTWAAGGAALSLGGLGGFALALDYFAPPVWPSLAAGLICAGPLLLWRGVREIEAGTDVARVAGGASRAPSTLLSLPLIAAGVAAAYHLIQQRTFDVVSIELGLSGLGLVALRESVSGLDLRRYAARLTNQDAHLRSVVSGSSDVTMLLDTGFLVRWQSSAAARQLALSDQDVVGRPVVTLVHPEDVAAVARCLTDLAGHPDGGPVGLAEARMRDGFGAWRDTEWSVTRHDLAAHSWTLVVHIRDVSRHKELERSVREQAATDRLTGLANRHGLAAALRDTPYRALILINLDVAGVNTVQGHEIGDAALVEAARRLRATVAGTDLPARLSAATFVVLTETGAVQAHLLATRLLTVLTEPYSVPGAVTHLPANAGLTDLTDDVDLEEALRRAELALHSTRGQPGSRAVEWYDESTQAQFRQRFTIEQELPGAVARGELDLAYQPVIQLAGGRPVGAEALLRWRSPALGTVSPVDFIPIAEQIGLLDEMTQWVLHWACRQLSVWAREGRDIWLSVNVSAATLARPAFVAEVTTTLETHLVPATQLVIEVAEPGIAGGTGSRATDPAADSRLEAVIDHLSQLRALGVRTAVDHFGSGATSLSQLRVLPLDLIKIDRQIFGEPAARTGAASAIVDVVVKLGRHIGVEVIAQGLEADEDLAVAREAGCRFGQGYVVSRPVPPEHLEAYLDAHRSPRV
jgi:diguanylate cyclase (GGDEF)-like protein/PAS domain S-box-containing protein